MNKSKIILISAGCLVLIAAVGLVGVPVLRDDLSQAIQRVKSFTQEASSTDSSREIFSNPLRGSDNDPNPTLDAKGVISLTNNERTSRGLTALTENAELKAAAQAKLKDMFDRQYFEHVSPDGHGPGYLAEQAGYDYIVVGENLALGNFKDNAALVAAWMASEGHRENILNDRYQEIGVAVGEGTYEGRSVWLAVQEFGRPLSQCPRTDTALRTQIDTLRTKSDSLSADLATRHAALDSMPRTSPEEQDAYNAKVAEYNAEVAVYNTTTTSLKSKIDVYNAEVRAFNACIKE